LVIREPPEDCVWQVPVGNHEPPAGALTLAPRGKNENIDQTGQTKGRAMIERKSKHLVVEVHGDEIIITLGSNFRAVYHKPEDQPQLVAKGTPHGNYDFLAQAWQAANDKARELGWIV
jgi:hypothetical protein